MSILDELKKVSDRAISVAKKLETEEATKTALVLPFIAALGYDIHNPSEVIPEFNADFGTKKGEKVDYAIFANNSLAFLIECKPFGAKLDECTGQLYRYFSVTEARIAILTDGVIYKFFSDLEDPNKLDRTPFYILDLFNLQDSLINDLLKLTKQDLDIDGLIMVAQDLKYIAQIKNILQREFDTPTWLVMNLIACSSYGGRRSASIVEWFSGLTKRAIMDITNDELRKRLMLTTNSNVTIEEPKKEEPRVEDNIKQIETTLEELEGSLYVRALASMVVDPTRIFMRDTASYCGVILDNNNRKPICRLHLNVPGNKFITFGKKIERFKIDSVMDVLKFRDNICAEIKNLIELTKEDLPAENLECSAEQEIKLPGLPE